MSMKIYDFVIVGGGICGCSVAYHLRQHYENILLVDKLDGVSKGASGAAGAFLSPLLGKPNKFKTLVNKALLFSIDFYKQHTANFIDNCGTIRIPKNSTDEEKFQSYIPFMEFPFEKVENGYLFKIGSVVNSSSICETLSKDTPKQLNYEVTKMIYDGNYWILNDEIITKNLILSTGANTKLIKEAFVNIRAIWGQRIDITTTNSTTVNYHKECSISRSVPFGDTLNQLSIGATHHRFEENREVNDEDTKELLLKASDITNLENIEVIARHGGARASSSDYFPIVGEVINSNATLNEFPYLKNGTHVNPSRFSRYPNLFILNGVGGRGFVLSPYLAKNLVEHIIDGKPLIEEIIPDRLFQRWVKKGV